MPFALHASAHLQDIGAFQHILLTTLLIVCVDIDDSSTTCIGTCEVTGAGLQLQHRVETARLALFIHKQDVNSEKPVL